ncbi:hypothetical protein TNCT_486141 [Trichonephila clavata]|uniref:Uncharacterized protein n=1 Tax=Trichonephila clavata TaxID=2740835 RepID=A0A8X6H8V1_TRICU|nr:hypothetical protein TNCT_486141 [Trichonephila clavata]
MQETIKYIPNPPKLNAKCRITSQSMSSPSLYVRLLFLESKILRFPSIIKYNTVLKVKHYSRRHTAPLIFLQAKNKYCGNVPKNDEDLLLKPPPTTGDDYFFLSFFY